MSQRTKIGIVFAALVVGVYLATQLLNGSGGIPAEFTESRLQGALISQTIVELSNDTVADLANINELEKERKLVEALDATSQLALQTQRIRDEAVTLSAEIEKMTRGLSGIRNNEAREAALEAVTSRLALISRLINYSAYLSELADALRNRFSGSAQSGDVARIVESINAEVQAINDLNAKAVAAMERFDNLMK